MHLTEIFHPTLFSSTKKHRRHRHYAAAKKRDYDDVLLPGFEALPSPLHVVSLSWLSSAFDFLSFTHSQAAKILKDSPLNDTGIDGSLSFYLDDSLKVLHIHNYILSEIDGFNRRALVIRIALHLLNSHSPEKLRRARDYLTKIEEVSSREKWKSSVLIGGDFSGDVEDPLKEFASSLKTATPPPTRKASAVLPEVYAVGLVSVLISTAAVSALRGSAVAEEVISLVASAEFAWADSFNELALRLGGLMRCGGEIREVREVEARVEDLIKAIDDVANDGGMEKLNAVVEELGRLTEELREGLGKLADRVNGVSKTIMLARWCIQDSFSREHAVSGGPKIYCDVMLSRGNIKEKRDTTSARTFNSS